MNYIRCIISYLSKSNKKPIYQKITSIGKYSLIKEIKKNNNIYIGKYKKNSKLYFIKTWSGNSKNFDYYALLNEWNASKMVHSFISKIVKTQVFKSPKPIEIIISKNSTSIVFQWIKGKALSKLPVYRQKEVLIEISDSIKIFSDKFNKHCVTIRPAIWYLCLIGIKIISSDLENITKAKIFLKALLSALAQSITKLSFSHGDIVPKNIVIYKNKYWLIDFGDASITIPNTDLFFSYNHPKSPKFTGKNIYKNSLLAACSALSAQNTRVRNHYLKLV